MRKRKYSYKEPALTIVNDLGGVTETSALAGVSPRRVYGWLWKGDIPTPDIRNLIQRSHARGRPIRVSALLNLPPEKITV
jgi:hypothetical protein